MIDGSEKRNCEDGFWTLGPGQTSNFLQVPNLTRELNACEVRRLNQLNSTV